MKTRVNYGNPRTMEDNALQNVDIGRAIDQTCALLSSNELEAMVQYLVGGLTNEKIGIANGTTTSGAGYKTANVRNKFKIVYEGRRVCPAQSNLIWDRDDDPIGTNTDLAADGHDCEGEGCDD